VLLVAAIIAICATEGVLVLEFDGDDAGFVIEVGDPNATPIELKFIVIEFDIVLGLDDEDIDGELELEVEELVELDNPTEIEAVEEEEVEEEVSAVVCRDVEDVVEDDIDEISEDCEGCLLLIRSK